MSPDQVADDAALRWLLGRGLLQPAGADALRRAAAQPGSPGLLALAAPRLRPEDAAELARVRAGALDRARAGRPDPSDSDLTLRLAPGSAAGGPPGLAPEDPTLRLQAPAPPASGRLTRSTDAGGLRRIGPYEVVRELARGGMGAVLVARRAGLDRQVALKVMLSGDAAGAEEVERFLTEARVAARLKHPNIVGILDVGTDGNRPYLVMDLIDGQSLKAKLERGPLDPREAAELCRDVAKALAYAHGQAVLHRDIKPHNILVTKDGTPVITDFGLAKDVGEGVARGQTKTGQVMGTPAYMPPEQAEGHSELVDRRADVYSLGATLYEALVGEAPFQGATPLNIITQVLSKDPVPPRRRRPDVDRDLDTIVLRCLEKEPERRYPTAAALADDLDRWLSDEPITARPATLVDRARKWARRNRAVATVLTVCGGLLLAGALGGGVWAIRATERARAQAAAEGREATERRGLEEVRAVVEDCRRRLAPRPEGDLTGAPIDERLRRYRQPVSTALALLAATERWLALERAFERPAGDVERARAAVLTAARGLEGLANESEQWSVSDHAVGSVAQVDSAEGVIAARALEEARLAAIARRVDGPFELAARGLLERSGPFALQLAAAEMAAAGDDETAARVALRLDRVSDDLARRLREALRGAAPPDRRARLDEALAAWFGAVGADDVLPPAPLLERPGPSAVGTDGLELLAQVGRRLGSGSGGADGAVPLGDALAARVGTDHVEEVRLALAALQALGKRPRSRDALDLYLRVEPRLELAAQALQALAALYDPDAPGPDPGQALGARLGGPRGLELQGAQLFRGRGAPEELVRSIEASARRAPSGERSSPAPREGGPVDARIAALRRNERLAPSELEVALAWLDRAIGGTGDTVENRWTRAMGRLQAGERRGALEDLDVAVERKPRDAVLHFQRARLRWTSGDREGAIADLDVAIATNPTMGLAFNVRAQLRLQARRLDLALRDADEAVRLRPDVPDVWIVRARVRVALGRAKEALEDAERGLAARPDDPTGLTTRGDARRCLGDLTGAAADFDAALARAPDDLSALCSRMELRVVLGQFEGAVADAEQLLAPPRRAAEDAHLRGAIANVLLASGARPRVVALLDAPGL